MQVSEGWLVAMLHLNQTLIPLLFVFTPMRLVLSDWWTPGDRASSTRKLTSARTLSSSSILRKDGQKEKEPTGVEECIFYTVAHHLLPGLLGWVIFSLNGAPVLIFPLHHPVVFSQRPSCTVMKAQNTLWILFCLHKDTFKTHELQSTLIKANLIKGIQSLSSFELTCVIHCEIKSKLSSKCIYLCESVLFYVLKILDMPFAPEVSFK